MKLYEFIEAQKAVFSVSLLTGVLGVSRSGYYAWRGRGVSGREAANVFAHRNDQGCPRPEPRHIRISEGTCRAAGPGSGGAQPDSEADESGRTFGVSRRAQSVYHSPGRGGSARR